MLVIYKDEKSAIIVTSNFKYNGFIWVLILTINDSAQDRY